MMSNEIQINLYNKTFNFFKNRIVFLNILSSNEFLKQFRKHVVLIFDIAFAKKFIDLLSLKIKLMTTWQLFNCIFFYLITKLYRFFLFNSFILRITLVWILLLTYILKSIRLIESFVAIKNKNIFIRRSTIRSLAISRIVIKWQL